MCSHYFDVIKQTTGENTAHQGHACFSGFDKKTENFWWWEKTQCQLWGAGVKNKLMWVTKNTSCVYLQLLLKISTILKSPDMFCWFPITITWSSRCHIMSLNLDHHVSSDSMVQFVKYGHITRVTDYCCSFISYPLLSLANDSLLARGLVSHGASKVAQLECSLKI